MIVNTTKTENNMEKYSSLYSSNDIYAVKSENNLIKLVQNYRKLSNFSFLSFHSKFLQLDCMISENGKHSSITLSYSEQESL